MRLRFPFCFFAPYDDSDEAEIIMVRTDGSNEILRHEFIYFNFAANSVVQVKNMLLSYFGEKRETDYGVEKLNVFLYIDPHCLDKMKTK